MSMFVIIEPVIAAALYQSTGMHETVIANVTSV
jgi:hypothetical protein